MTGWYDITNYIVEGPDCFDAAEVSGVREIIEDDPTESHCEPCEDRHAEFWSVYLHFRTGGCEVAGDFSDRADAEAYARQLEVVLGVA
jgi:hypothetical protein